MPNSMISFTRLFTLFLIACFLPACSDEKEEGVHSEASQDLSTNVVEIIKSPNDRRDYRALVLDNQLKVLLISDPETDKAAASVDVNSGSNSNPDAFEGLAHFLEHMLFLGTKKFPESGEYQEYIASHGGRHNAYTSYENTSYFFDIDKDYLEPTLDRFAQFFIAPLFTPEYVDRERNAVNSEYQSNLQNDGRRSYAAFKAIINQNHPLSLFSVGNLETLQNKPEGNLRDALLEHYNENYSANMMSAAILGAESLDELEVMAREYFSGIENRNVSAPGTMEEIFTDGQLPAMLQIIPVRDSRSLSYTFPIPVVREHYKSKPLSYLGNIIGHEGEGSLLSLLKEKGWVNGLSAGGNMSYPDNATFSISVSLTEEGVNKIDEISSLVFQFIELVKREGIQEWLFEEQQTLADLSFAFQETSPPSSYVSAMSRNLQEYPAAEVISAAYAFENYKPEFMNEVLNQLRPDNALLTFTSKTASGDIVEPLFGANYSYSALSPERIASWQSDSIDPALAIASPNLFLPEDIELKSYAGLENGSGGAEDKPVLILNEGGTSLWFKQDNAFKIPRANFYVYAMTPKFNDSLTNSLLSSFVVSLVNDKLNEYSYPANLAGVNYGVAKRARGFSIRVSGYNDKQAVLLEELLKTFVAADFAEDRFDIIKTEMIRSWENASKQKPYVRAFQQAQALLVNPYWSEQQKIEAVADITLDEVKAFVPGILDNLRIEALYHGNVIEADALAMMNIVATYLDSSEDASSPPFGTIVKLKENTRVVQNVEVDHEDSAIVVLMQGPDDTLETRAKVNLLSSILRSPFFDILRTEKQLGYVVNAGTMSILKTSGLVFYIESPTTDPIALENNINIFLADYESELTEMSLVKFNDIKSGLLNSLREKPQRMSSLSGRYWGDILTEEYEEDSTLALADAIEALEKDEILSYYREYLSKPESGRLVARSVGTPHREVFLSSDEGNLSNPENTVLIEETVESFQAFKDSSELFYFNSKL